VLAAFRVQSVRRRLPSTTGLEGELVTAVQPQQRLQPVGKGKRVADKAAVTRLLKDAAGSGSGAGPSGQGYRELLTVVGAPEVRQLAREVVGSAVWGGVRATYECAQELVPASWRSAAGAMPPTVALSCLMALCLHSQSLV
jgi:hypothetical protein